MLISGLRVDIVGRMVVCRTESISVESVPVVLGEACGRMAVKAKKEQAQGSWMLPTKKPFQKLLRKLLNPGK